MCHEQFLPRAVLGPRSRVLLPGAVARRTAVIFLCLSLAQCCEAAQDLMLCLAFLLCLVFGLCF